MAGLTSGGFIPETYDSIKQRIEGKLEVFNPGFDFSPDSPDGQMIGIMTFEIYQAWQQLAKVYDSYNPQVATGAALRNLGLITGLPYGVAERSQAVLETQGTTGTIIPKQSILVDADGNEFYTAFEVAVPSNLTVVASVAGAIPVPAGSITSIRTPIAGWSGVTQTTDGVEGSPAMSEQQYKNYRQRTVMRNYTSVADTMQAKLIELGLGQASVVNNSSTAPVNGVPANTIHVTVGEPGIVTDEEIARVILETNALGCPTYGSDSATVVDSQGYSQTINFSKAVEQKIEVTLDVTYLSENTAGANVNIITSLRQHINNLKSGEDVIWSRLFAYVTPFAEAQINTITIAKFGQSHGTTNITLTNSQFASITDADITLTVDGNPI